MARRPGQPTRYDPAYCAQLVAHMAAGLSFSSFAAKVGVHRDTLYEWCARHRAFSDAKKRGEAASLLWWETIGQAAMLGTEFKVGSKTHDGRKVSTALWIFTMKCRFRAEGWNEDGDGGPVDPNAKKKTFALNYARKEKA